MPFNSIHFLIFFPVVLLLYFAIPHRYRWILLLIGSYYFYMSWKPEYLILLVITTLTNYACALGIDNTENKIKKRFFLLSSLITNLGLLFTFKYFNFFSSTIKDFLGLFKINFSAPCLDILLPIGISFYTLQALGYIIDVYKGQIKPEKHLGIFALYVSFFPQLVAGPIERASNLMPQFFEEHVIDTGRITEGLRLMLWGFFKKIVIADNLGAIVTYVYENPSFYTGELIISATIFFAFQIYCDFSGYSDIAIGAAHMMGFRLMENFNKPYAALSIGDFWKRWHISLTSWFRDYVFFPLGRNHVQIFRWYLNAFIVFVISGLWHGANLTFLAWGAFHGLLIIAGHATHKFQKKLAGLAKRLSVTRLYKFFRIVMTFVLVCLGWVFFRANSLSDAIYIVTHMFQNWNKMSPILNVYFFIEITDWLAIALFLTIDFFGIRRVLFESPIWLRWMLYLILALGILFLGGPRNQFIYFQF